jgi:hypothetical protein
MRQTWRIMPLMTLLSVLLWCLYPLAPAKRLYELTRYALHQTLAKLSDERWIAWLCQDPDDPRSFPTFERWIDNLGSGIDLLIHLRARELLGLPNHDWTPPREAMLQPRRSRSFEDLWRRLELCVLKFGELERLAARRAIRLQRLLAAPPQTAEQLAAAAWRAAAATTLASGSPAPARAATTTAAAGVAGVAGAAARARAGLRVRAPPWRSAIPCSPLPIPSRRPPRRTRPHAPRPKQNRPGSSPGRLMFETRRSYFATSEKHWPWSPMACSARQKERSARV